MGMQSLERAALAAREYLDGDEWMLSWIHWMARPPIGRFIDEASPDAVLRLTRVIDIMETALLAICDLDDYAAQLAQEALTAIKEEN